MNIFRVLLHGDANLAPQAVLELTPTELWEVAMNPPEVGQPLLPDGVRPQKPWEKRAYQGWFFSLTPRQRLELKRYGRVISQGSRPVPGHLAMPMTEEELQKEALSRSSTR